jgi:RNA polymerase sigma factor (sigma-70 family)
MKMTGSGSDSAGSQVNKYLAKLAKHGLLDAEEERKLIRLAKRHDQAALTRLVLMNIRLVLHSVIRLGGAELADDLVPEGIIGLIRGIRKYDLKRKEKPRLSTYATHWVEHAIRRYLSNQRRTVRLPVHAEELAWRISKETARCLLLEGGAPSVEELTERINAALALADAGKEKTRCVTVKAVARARDAAGTRFISVNHTDHAFDPVAAVTSEAALSAGPEVILTEDGEDACCLVERAEAIAAVRVALARLTTKEQAVIRLRFCDGLTLEDAATALHKRGITATELTRERVRQIQEKALDKLRPTLIRAGLAPEGFVQPSKTKGGRQDKLKVRD